MDWVDWSVMVVRVVLVFFVLLIAVMLYIWMERKVIADMQTRVGPMRAGPRGMLITLADGIKLFFKEGITPTNADRPVYLIAPILAMFPGFLAFCTIPFGEPVELFGRVVPFQITDLNIGILWVLAMTSIGVYGVVLAGWSSGSNYPLLGYLAEPSPSLGRVTIIDGQPLFYGLSRERNTLRLPAYSRLDVRADRAFNWSGRRMVLFVEVANVLDRSNLRNTNYSVDRAGRVFETTESMIPIVPSGGFVIEF